MDVEEFRRLQAEMAGRGQREREASEARVPERWRQLEARIAAAFRPEEDETHE